MVVYIAIQGFLDFLTSSVSPDAETPCTGEHGSGFAASCSTLF